MNILYISIFYPDTPTAYKISPESLKLFDNNLQKLFHDDCFQDYVTELETIYTTDYSDSSDIKYSEPIDTVFISE